MDSLCFWNLQYLHVHLVSFKHINLCSESLKLTLWIQTTYEQRPVFHSPMDGLYRQDGLYLKIHILHFCLYIRLESLFKFRLLIEFAEDFSKPDWMGYIMASAFLAIILLQSFFFHQLMFQSINLGLRVRTALISTIFKKVRVTSVLPDFYAFLTIILWLYLVIACPIHI